MFRVQPWTNPGTLRGLEFRTILQASSPTRCGIGMCMLFMTLRNFSLYWTKGSVSPKMPLVLFCPDTYLVRCIEVRARCLVACCTLYALYRRPHGKYSTSPRSCDGSVTPSSLAGPQNHSPQNTRGKSCRAQKNQK